MTTRSVVREVYVLRLIEGLVGCFVHCSMDNTKSRIPTPVLNVEPVLLPIIHRLSGEVKTSKKGEIQVFQKPLILIPQVIVLL